ncbi:MAG: hypothetical protein HOV94_34600 [Saccharothrix sp.]|nr:hypothetical protein [Saccharothrix sp.]
MTTDPTLPSAPLPDLDALRVRFVATRDLILDRTALPAQCHATLAEVEEALSALTATRAELDTYRYEVGHADAGREQAERARDSAKAYVEQVCAQRDNALSERDAARAELARVTEQRDEALGELEQTRAQLDEQRDRAEAANNLHANAEHHLKTAREDAKTWKVRATKYRRERDQLSGAWLQLLGDAAPAAAPKPAAEYVRVVVVVDWVRHRVHTITSDDAAAQQATRELAAKYDGNPNAATMWAWAVDVPAAAPKPADLDQALTDAEIASGVRPSDEELRGRLAVAGTGQQDTDTCHSGCARPISARSHFLCDPCVDAEKVARPKPAAVPSGGDGTDGGPR